MAHTKRAIKVVVANDTDATAYITLLSNLFDVTVLKHKEAFDLNRSEIDLVLFTGGEDVNPGIYGQNIGKFTSINENRDSLEQDLYYHYQTTPKLGICRGAQFLTVMAGGKLIQHVTGHGGTHNISVPNYGDYPISSTHHQMMYPFDMKKERYRLVGYSTNFKSDTSLDGDHEEMKVGMEFLEPEIVEYTDAKSFCIQGHPEFEDTSEPTKDLILMLISRWFDRCTTQQDPSKGKSSSRPWADFLEQPIRRGASKSISYYDNKGIDISGDSFQNLRWTTSTAKVNVQKPSSTLEDFEQAVERVKTMMNNSASTRYVMGGDGIVREQFVDTPATPYQRTSEPEHPEEPTSKSEGLENMF